MFYKLLIMTNKQKAKLFDYIMEEAELQYREDKDKLVENQKKKCITFIY